MYVVYWWKLNENKIFSGLAARVWFDCLYRKLCFGDAFLVDVVRLLDCGKFCSVCYARLARVLVALSLCLEKNPRARLLYLCWLL